MEITLTKDIDTCRDFVIGFCAYAGTGYNMHTARETCIYHAGLVGSVTKNGIFFDITSGTSRFYFGLHYVSAYKLKITDVSDTWAAGGSSFKTIMWYR